jgi:proline racemase
VVQLIRAIDAHVGGQPLRLLVEGAPDPAGKTIRQKGEWLRRHADHLRTALVRLPRGHADMLAAQLVTPISPGAHAGLVFMGADGCRAMSGHGTMAVTTIAVERELIHTRDSEDSEVRLTYDTEAGGVHALARVERRGDRTRVDSVAVTNVPAFVHSAGHGVKLGAREFRVDVAFGGLFYAIVDTEAVGVPLTGSRIPDLRRLGIQITRAVNDSLAVEHPTVRSLADLAGCIFTGPPQDPESHLRTVAVSGTGAVNLSPGGTGMSAVMSVLDAMGMLPSEGPLVLEGIAGALFRGRAIGRTAVGELPAISTEIEGTAWITGEHAFLLDEDDPFREGFVV